MKRLIPVALVLLTASAALADVSSWNQRRSLMTIGFPSLPQPNSELDSGDRAQLIGVFRGQLEPEVTSTGSTSTGITRLRILKRRRG